MNRIDELKLKKLRLALEGNRDGGCLGSLMLVLTNRYGSYEYEDVAFLEDYLDGAPQTLKIAMLKILCRYGGRISDYLERLGDLNQMMSAAVLEIAEKQGDADTVVGLVMKNKALLNRATAILMRMGRADSLMPFMLSGDKDVVGLACTAIEKGMKP